jgi:outer membrane receptor protein involved in Fe transport
MTGLLRQPLSGRIIDQQDHAPVELAHIILYKATDSVPVGYTATDQAGRFAFTCKDAGDYYIAVSILGYKKLQTARFVLAAQNQEVALPDIPITQEDKELSEIVVTGRKPRVVYKIDKQVIDAAETLSAAGGTAADILMQMPSLRVDAEGGITFRGSSGFKVYIDGKPSSLDGAAILEQMPAGQIDNIEILTVPSASNNADGAAGIINILTKKTNTEGRSGMINLMGSTVLSRNIDFLYAFRNKRFRWQLSGEASRRFVLSDYDQLKTIKTDDLLTVDHSTGDRRRHTALYYLQSSFDWFRDNTTWSAALTGGYRDRWRGGTLHYDDTYESIATGEKNAASFDGKDYVNLYEYQWRGDLGVAHHFPGRKGHQLTASMFGLYEGHAMEHFSTDLWDMDGNQVQGHRAWEFEYRFTGQLNADYIYPFDAGEGKIESGYQLYTYTEDGDYTIDMFEPEQKTFVRQNDLYNKYLFRRDIHALYAMISHKYARISYQAGLRGEYTYRKLGNNLAWAQNVRKRFDLFPSIHLSYTLNDQNMLRFACARRITQPELFYMEPYVVYVDYNTAQQGNPYIKPEYTTSIELGYSHNVNNNSLTATLFHRARQDKIERLRVPYHASVTLDSMANVGDDYATGIDLSAVIAWNKRWNMDANAEIYHYRIKNRFETANNDKESRNWQLSVNNHWDIGNTTRMRLEAYYVGPMVGTQGRVDGFFYMNFTLRQQLLNRKLTASLVVKDLLSTAEYVNMRTSVGMESLSKIHPRSPLLTLNLSYTFNQFTPQKKAEKVDHDLFEGTNR